MKPPVLKHIGPGSERTELKAVQINEAVKGGVAGVEHLKTPVDEITASTPVGFYATAYGLAGFQEEPIGFLLL
jgi:hypothetical protein